MLIPFVQMGIADAIVKSLDKRAVLRIRILMALIALIAPVGFAIIIKFTAANLTRMEIIV